MEYLKQIFGYNTSLSPKKCRVEEITQSDSIESPLQIISNVSLWEEIMSTYNTERFDTAIIREWHFENGVVHYLQTRNLKLNLQTLKPCKRSLLQNTLNPILVSRIKNNNAYQKFSEEKLSFSKYNTAISVDLTQLKNDYLDYYFNLDYDNRITYDKEFSKLAKQDQINLIRHKHQELLDNCQGLRFNI